MYFIIKKLERNYQCDCSSDAEGKFLIACRICKINDVRKQKGYLAPHQSEIFSIIKSTEDLSEIVQVMKQLLEGQTELMSYTMIDLAIAYQTIINMTPKEEIIYIENTSGKHQTHLQKQKHPEKTHQIKHLNLDDFDISYEHEYENANVNLI
jgi:hypothetical protein